MYMCNYVFKTFNTLPFLLYTRVIFRILLFIIIYVLRCFGNVLKKKKIQLSSVKFMCSYRLYNFTRLENWYIRLRATDTYIFQMPKATAENNSVNIGRKY